MAKFWSDHCYLNREAGFITILNDRTICLATVDLHQQKRRHSRELRYERHRSVLVTDDDKVAIILERYRDCLRILGMKIQLPTGEQELPEPKEIEYEDKFVWSTANVHFWLWKDAGHTYLVIVCGRKEKVHRIDLTHALARFQ